MNLCARISSLCLASLLFLCTCGSYAPVRLSRDVPAGDESPGVRNQKKRDPVLEGYGDKRHQKSKKGIAELRKGMYRFYIKKYFALAGSGTPVGEMNDKGVEYALQGSFREAEIIFREVLREDRNNPAACNNLGIVYELFGRHKESFAMYSRACLLEPDNPYFRKNLMFMNDEKEK